MFTGTSRRNTIMELRYSQQEKLNLRKNPNQCPSATLTNLL